MSPGSPAEKVRRALRERVAERLAVDEATLEACSADASIFRRRPLAVVVPRDVEDVVAVLAVAREHRVAVTARGGGTNTGGAALGGGIVLAFRPWGELARVRDAPGGAVVAGPGARHDELQRFLGARGLCLPSDPSSGPLSLIGGNIATRASGPHALRYGAIDRYLERVRVVLADGRIVDTADRASIPAGLATALEAERAALAADAEARGRVELRAARKCASGYNLAGLLREADPGRRIAALLAGSAGTLGIVVEAAFAGRPLPSGRAAALLCFEELSGACRLVPAFRAAGAAAVEIMNARSVGLVRSRFPEAGLPLESGHLLLVELDGDGALDRAYELATEAVRSGERLAAPAEVSDDEARIGGLWKARKLMLPILRAREGRYRALSVVNDVGVPPARLAEAMESIEAIFDRRGLDAFVYGHAGDGNLHLRPLLDTRDPALPDTVAGLAEEVYGLVLGLDGTVTPEHGMGMLRAPFLEREWGSGVVRRMRGVKRAFDPEGTLNPGAVLPELGLREALARHFAPFGREET